MIDMWIGDAYLATISNPESNYGHTVEVKFPEADEEITENFKADAEIAVQKWLDKIGVGDFHYFIGATTGQSRVYENSIIVDINY